MREVTKKKPGETAAEIAQRQQTMDWNEAETTLGVKGSKAKRRECETTLAVTALREAWRDACESGTAGVRDFAINGVVHPQWPNEVLAQRRALEALGKGEAATMTLAQSDPEGALNTHRDTLTRSGEILQRISSEPDSVEKVVADKDVCHWLKSYAPQAWEHVETAQRRYKQERRGLKRKLERAGLDHNKDAGATARRCAAMERDQAVALASEAPILLRMEHTAIWQGLWPKLKEWGRQIVKDAEKGHADPRCLTQRHAALLDAPVVDENTDV